MDPCIPAAWPGFSAVLTLEGMRWEIVVENPGGACRGVGSAMLDGAPTPCSEGAVEVALCAGSHILRIVLGRAPG